MLRHALPDNECTPGFTKTHLVKPQGKTRHMRACVSQNGYVFSPGGQGPRSLGVCANAQSLPLGDSLNRYNRQPDRNNLEGRCQPHAPPSAAHRVAPERECDKAPTPVSRYRPSTLKSPGARTFAGVVTPPRERRFKQDAKPPPTLLVGDLVFLLQHSRRLSSAGPPCSPRSGHAA